MVISKRIRNKVLSFLQEMEAAGVSAAAPDHMLKLIDINKKEDAQEDDKVFNVLANRK